MKKLLFIIAIIFTTLSCEKYGKELNNGKDGCINCIVITDTTLNTKRATYKYDTIKRIDTTTYFEDTVKHIKYDTITIFNPIPTWHDTIIYGRGKFDYSDYYNLYHKTDWCHYLKSITNKSSNSGDSLSVLYHPTCK